MIAHMPMGPMWLCDTCSPRPANDGSGEPIGVMWPCAPGKARLIDEFEGEHVALSLYLASCFTMAIEDMPDAQVGIMYGRFIGWARGWTV